MQKWVNESFTSEDMENMSLIFYSKTLASI